MTPLVSINMAAYNAARFLPTTIESVLQQTYTNWELIIIDDGSTDKTFEILRSFSDPRIKVITHEENKGVVETRNNALKHSSGTYIAILDSDDIWKDKEKLTKQVEYMEAHPECAIVGTFIELIDEKEKKIGSDSYELTDQRIRECILRQNQFAHSSILIRKEAIEAGYLAYNPAEDFELILRIGEKWKLANLPFYTTEYRIHSSGISKKGKKELATQILRIIKKYKTSYPNYYPALLKGYIRRALFFLL